ncbi:hypothetical protein B0H63DRAFT_62858 [Podospora didyma]|uniref:Uncharacterized protein n=1 Tax=Podospora didyma TaxID=330526 RepID=A0AAE0P7W5_9PEZI|nr:hypothetical protein B0H63DRAFT_62858 [Podospora didyma]
MTAPFKHRRHLPRLSGIATCCVLYLATTSNAAKYDSKICKENIIRIRNEPGYSVGGVTNATLDKYLWKKPIDGFNYDVVPNRFGDADPYVVINLEGCNVICGDGAETNKPQTALSIVATWVFPLTVFLSLPFASSHGGRIWRAVGDTLAAVSVWLGSPPTALTSALFELYQVRQCSQRSRLGTRSSPADPAAKQLWKDAYFVLVCINQFAGSEGSNAFSRETLQALVYGLLRPLSSVGEGHQDEIDLTARLLSEMASQLRALHAGNVKRTLISLLSFVAAFCFASVLAFGDFGESTTVFILSLGLLWFWLPMLVTLTCVIPNRVSPERQMVLFSRWLYNVSAIETSYHPPITANTVDSQISGTITRTTREPIKWWSTFTTAKEIQPFGIGELASHGRSLRHCGLLASAFLKQTPIDPGKGGEESFPDTWSPDTASLYAGRIANELESGGCPWSWFFIAGASLIIVWAEIMISFVCDFLTPTVGLGCWSGCTLLYAILVFTTAGINWGVQRYFRGSSSKLGERGWVGWLLELVAHFCNIVTLGWLVVITGLIASGAMFTCWCSSVGLTYTSLGRGGYMDLENISFYPDHYHVKTAWIICASFGAAIPVVIFGAAGFMWFRCRRLWKEAKGVRGDGGIPLAGGVVMNSDMMAWLQH